MKKQKQPPRLRRILVGGLFALIALAAAGLLSYMHVVSRVVHVERVTLYLEDLPPGFDGRTILFVSDIDMVGLNGPGTAARLMASLEKLEPDILILGGDYAGNSLLDKLNSTGDELALEEDRRELFSTIADFNAPLGKYAVAGEGDAGAEDLASELALGRITYLDDSGGGIRLGGEEIYIVGFKDYSQGSNAYSGIAQGFSEGDCVIAVTHNPSSVSGLMTAEAGDAGQWCDVILTGHTHDGQIRFGERSLIQLTQQESRYPTGWSKESGVFILVSPGAGCETVNLRIGTQAQVHLITLKRGTSSGDSQ